MAVETYPISFKRNKDKPWLLDGEYYNLFDESTVSCGYGYYPSKKRCPQYTFYVTHYVTKEYKVVTAATLRELKQKVYFAYAKLCVASVGYFI